MRKQFITTIEEIFATNEKAILVLGDIGVFSFRFLAEKYPDRVINIGICEQATIGVLAGLAKEGFLPIFYSIAPFAVERCLEQIKIDIGYQNLPIAIVSVGASYDYAALGCTHHCPADVAIIKTVPNMVIIVPGCSADADTLFKEAFGKTPVYMRLSESGHNTILPVELGKSICVKSGKRGVVIAIGTTLENVISATEELGVTLLYYTTIIPFDEICATGKIAIVEPFYKGTVVGEVMDSCVVQATVLSIGVPHKFLTNYGTAKEHDIACGLDAESLRKSLTSFFNGQ